MWEKIESVGWIVFTLATSILFGMLFGFWYGSLVASDTISIQNTEQKSVPVITLLNIENGKLIGNASEEIRLVLVEKEISIAQQGNFITDITPILPMIRQIPAPVGSKWVASKSGKRYYPLDHPSAFLLSAKNRVFYASEEEAKNDGKERYTK